MATAPTTKSANMAGGIDVTAWNSGAVSSIPLSTSTFSAALAERPISSHRPATETLDIPLDAEAQKSVTQQRREARVLKNRAVGRDDDSDTDEDVAAAAARRRSGEPRRRDSMKRREALLKGKEGSRRRQKWENDRLLGNPAFQPPEPHDWAPHPTHPVHSVPYVLAPLWDEGYAAASKARAQARQRQKSHKQDSAGQAQGHVPRELREKLKRARGARTLLMELEEQVRSFVRQWEEERILRRQGWDVDVRADVEDVDIIDVDDDDSMDEVGDEVVNKKARNKFGDKEEEQEEEEEVIFIGRRKSEKRKKRSRHNRNGSGSGSDTMRRDKLVFDSLVDDTGASFGRWLVHNIASYYNLSTWSVTTGNPARREAYVGIPEKRMRKSYKKDKKMIAEGINKSNGNGNGNVEVDADAETGSVVLPRPLWVVV